MRSMSYGELANCQRYAEDVVSFYKMCNNGDVPRTASWAETVVREYNNEFRKFKAMFGYSIRGYIDTIVECIGQIVECE